ncbi:MAG: ferritin family protein [Desulfohalobiaceae bacterium]|nr:ferritin family protein [Desulfohalobiaceae bacterium]
MNFENLDEILDFAIEKEIEASDFYRTLAKEERYSDPTTMFEEFAGEEEKHKKMLQNFKEKGVSRSLQEYKLKWIKDLKRSDYLVDLEYKPGLPYNDILLLAIKREEKSLKLYNELLDKVDDGDSKKLFQVLCQEEAKHKLTLETMYDDYMAKMGD